MELTRTKAKENLTKLVDKFESELTVKGSQKNQIQRQIEKTDKEIDNLVYKLYGITEKERKIIEG